MTHKQELTVDGQSVTVSNLDKLMYPEAGFTKAHVIEYYIRASRFLLPHLKNRPITLKRYPEGINGTHFYEKDAPKFTPDWVRTFPVRRKMGGTDIRYVLVDDLRTLVWCANLANLELHPFLHLAPEIERPTALVFDLDPGEGSDVLSCIEVALFIRDIFDRLRLKLFAKVSGSKGLQIYVPLNTRVTYEVTQPVARSIAGLLAQQHPSLIVSEMDKSVRKKRVFIDWSQNSDFKTTAGVYSLRAKRATPFVSMPVTWDELEEARAKHDATLLDFTPTSAIERLEGLGDLFEPVRTLKQKLPSDLTRSLAPA